MPVSIRSSRYFLSIVLWIIWIQKHSCFHIIVFSLLLHISMHIQILPNNILSNNNNLLQLYSTLHRRGGGGGGESAQSPPVCSIHLDDAAAAILRQNAQHTPVYWWRGDRVMKPISAWGWLGGHDGQRPMDARLTPLLFFKEHPGIFNDHRESGPRFNVSSKGWCFLQYSVPVATLGH